MFDNKPNRHFPPHHRRLLCEALEARTMLTTVAGSAAPQQTLADLPVAAQHAISSAIGQDQAAYHAASGALGVTMGNPANGFTAQVQAGTLLVSTRFDTWDMALAGLGYCGMVQPVGTAQTSANGNRVDCNYGTIDEWYVNGPSGLEQGFTVPPPRPGASGSLTVELALGGDLVGTVNAAGSGLTLTGPDGTTALGYTGLTACDATGKTLPASLEVQTIGGSQTLLIHVNDAGTQGPITIDPFVQEARLTASDGKAGDEFGTSVSISGSTVVVGVPVATVGGHPYQGAAYVFTDRSSGWADMTQTAKLTASDGNAGDELGASVSISGNTVVAGALATVGGNAYQGAAYVFTEPASGWANMTQTAKLTASDDNAGGFGNAVSISGNTVLVGATGATVDGNKQEGAAYVFAEPSSGWADMTETATLTATDGAASDDFGESVSISGNTLVVGAIGAAIGGNVRQGAAYVFTEPGTGWTDMTQTAKLIASDGRAGDVFGVPVSISGNTLVVGAIGANAAYEFTEPSSGWADMTETVKLTASSGRAGDDFGISVSISGNTLVVGASSVNAAYEFTEPSSGWADMTETAKLTASNGHVGDEFGGSVSISGNTVVVGAENATATIVNGSIKGGPGAAYVFETPPTPVTVTPADWTSAGLTLTLGSDGNLHVYATGTTTDAVPPVAPASISSIDITSPSDTSADLTIDSSNGNPVPTGGLRYSGAGGLIVTGSNTVTLSGANSYTGGTLVTAGTLLVNAASGILDGSSLTVDAGGDFVFSGRSSAVLKPSPSSLAALGGLAAPGSVAVVASPGVVARLASSNINPQGIADPPAALSRPTTPQTVPESVAQATDAALQRLAPAAAYLPYETQLSSGQSTNKQTAIQAIDLALLEFVA